VWVCVSYAGRVIVCRGRRGVTFVRQWAALLASRLVAYTIGVLPYATLVPPE